MADELKILISTGFSIDKDGLLNELKDIQKNAKISFNVDESGANKLKSVQVERIRKEQEYWNLKRQRILEQQTSTSQEILDLRKYYSELEKTTAKEKELADERKRANQFSSEKNAQSFYQNIIKLSEQYNKNLMTSIEFKQKLDSLMYKSDGGTVAQFNNLDTTKQSQLTNLYDKVSLDAKNKAYTQLNKLLTEEYNLRIRIEEAKLSRYEAKDNSIEEERVTVLERELQKRLEINQAQKEVVNNNINDNGLENQEKLNQLQREEINLKSELAIKVAQVASSQQLLTAKTQNDLDNFSKGMSVNLDGLARKYDYVSGASKKIDEFRQTIAGVTAENGKLYVSTVQADGSVKKSQTTIQALRMQYRQLRNEIQGSITIFDTLKQNLRKFGSWIIGGSIFMQFTRGITSAVTSVNELSDSITTLRRVSSGTEADYQNLASDMFKIADQIGGSAKALVDSMAEFSKLGYDFAEAKNLAEQASKYASAGDMSVNDATTSLISTYQVFNGQLDKHIGKVITATEITDLFNEAGNRLSVTSEQVGGALQRSANALSLANNSFSESVALIASANKSIQNAETVGTALRSISMRLRGVSEDGEDLDSKLGETISNITGKYGKAVDIFDKSTGTFKSTYDILVELSKVWGNLGDADQALLLEKVAGKQRAEVLGAILNNAEDLTKALDVAAESVGSVDLEMEVIMGTTTKKIEQLKNAFDELAGSAYDANITKFFVDGATSILQFTTSMGGLIPILGIVATVLLNVKKEALALSAINTFVKLKEARAVMSSFTSEGSLLVGMVGSIKNSFIKAKESIVQYTADMAKSSAQTATLAPAISLATAGIGALIAVVTLVSMAMFKAKQRHEEYIQSLRDTITSSQENISKLELLKDEYTELSKKQQKTVEDTKRLAEIQDTLIYKFGAKKDAIDLLNGSLKDNIALINELSKIDIAQAISAQADIIKETKEKWDDRDDISFKLTVSDKDTVAEWDKMIEQMTAKYGEALTVSLNENTGIRSVRFDETKLSAEECVEALQYLRTSIQDNYKLLYDTGGYSTYASSMTTWISLYQSMNEEIKTQIELRRQELNLSNPKYTNISENTDVKDLGVMRDYAKKQLLVEVDSTKLLMYEQLLNEIDSQIEYINSQKIEPSAQGVTKTWDGIYESFKGLTEETDILEDALEELNSTQELSKETIEALAKKYPELTESMRSTSEATAAIKKVMAQNTFNNMTSQISDLTSVLKDLKDENGLTEASFKKISESFPELLGYMGDETELAQQIADKMNDLKQTQNRAYAEMLMDSKEYYAQKLREDGAWVTGTQNNLNGLLNSLGVGYQVDLKNYESMEQAKATITSNLIQELGQAWAEYFGMIADGMSLGDIESTMYINGDESMGTNMDYEAYNKAKKVHDVFENLANSFANIDSVITDGLSSSSSNSSGSAENSLKDKYDKIIAQILSSTTEVERAIETSKQRLEMAELLGNQANVEKEKENIKQLYDKRKNLIHDQAEKLRSLLSTVKDEEIRATISSEITGLQDNFHDIQITSIEDRIARIQDLHDVTVANLSDEIDLLNQQRTLMNQDSDEYKDSYAKEYQIVLNQQLATVKSIKDLQAQGISDESEAIKKLKAEWKGYETTRLGVIKTIAEANKQSQLNSLEKANEGLQSLLDMTMAMIKQQYDNEKSMIQDLIKEREDAVKKDIDGYKATIDAKKKLLKKDKDDRSYQQNLTEKQQSIADKENRLEALSRDDSDKAKAEYKTLYNELLKERQELDNLQYDHSIEKQEDLLDEELQRYEDARNEELDIFKSQKEAEIKEIEDYASREVNIREEAMKLIRSKSKKFYDDLIDYNSKYSDGVVETVVTAWENGYSAMDTYNGGLHNVLDTLKKISSEMSSINAAPLSQFVDAENYNTTVGNVDTSIKNQTSNTPTQNNELATQQLNQQKYLHSLMLQAQKDGNKQLITWIENERLKWGMDKYGKITKQYHDGGFVGGLKSNEEFAKLLKGEFIVTDKMQNNFVNNVMPKIMGSNSTPSLTLNVDRFMDIDKLDNSTDLERLSKNLVDNVLNKITGAYKLKFGI